MSSRPWRSTASAIIRRFPSAVPTSRCRQSSPCRSTPTTCAPAALKALHTVPPSPEARVTLENWQRVPFNRWSFLHTREVIPTANIGKGDGEALGLGRGRGGLESLELPTEDGARLTLGEFLENSWTDGMIVLHRGRIELEAYRNGMTPTTRHIAMSVSK